MKTKEFRLGDCVQCNPTVKLIKGNQYSLIDIDRIVVGRKFVTQKALVVYIGQGGCKFENGDTLMARITPCLENGKMAVAKIETKGIGSTELFVFRNKKGVTDKDFVYYLFKQQYIRNLAANSMTGASGRQRADLKFIKRIKIALPALEVQHRIASILSTYDSLIENNTKRIRLLEKMAENLYKEWFVRFRFPGHEKVEMENGLPKGWKWGKLGDIVEFLNGFAFKSQDFCIDGKFSIVTIKNVQTEGFDGSNTDKIEEIPSRMPKHCLLKDGDVLLSLTGNIGRVCRVIGNGYLLNQRVAKLKSERPLFCYCTFKSDYIYQSLNVISYGTAQLNLSPVKALIIKLQIPATELMDRFEQQVEPVFAEIDNLQQQNTLLARQRDLLLPRLMSGKLEV